MKKNINRKTIIAAGIIGSALLLGGCLNSAQRSVADYIGIEAAQEAALSAAGLSEADADFSISGLDSKDGTFFYEVEFTSGDKSYSYDIDALTGVVIEEAISPIEGDEATAKAEAAPAGDSNTSKAGGNAGTDTGSTVGNIGSISGGLPDRWSGSLIDSSDAEATALADAGFDASEVTRLRTELDYDDGWFIYEVEFFGPDGLEYDYAINAETGEIVASGYEQNDDSYWLSKLQGGSGNAAGVSNGTGKGQGGSGQAAGSGNGGGHHGAANTAASISADEAADIALERVPGATANDLRIELDHDDGRLVYEGEIVYDRMEYEFKIDALSGSILEWDSERWDR